MPLQYTRYYIFFHVSDKYFFSDTLTQDHKERETRTNLTTVAISQLRDSQFFFLLLDEYTECW